ncbi:MAG: nitrilase-related carbon-nitrogen hydrolase [Thermomicrobiales bacterium]
MDDQPVQAPAPYRVAVIQFEPTLFAKEANVAALLRLVEDAAAGGAKLIVTPEMATSAYCWADRAEVAPEVEPIPGPSTERFGEVARKYGCWIVLGMPEVDPETDVFYNSAVLIGPEGPVGVYRKTHAFISEPTWAKDGDLGLPVFETPLGRIAMTICMDACYPETARIPALAEADVICFPTNWLTEKSPSPSWIARAVENGVYFLAANRYGLERGVQFSGGSAVINPDGSLQGVVDNGDGIAWGEVDIARARDKGWRGESPEDLLADRRPEAYGRSTLNSYLWPAADFHGLYDLRPLPESRESRVAVVQMTPLGGDVAGNLARIAQEIAALAPVDLVVFPELALTGAVTDVETARDVTQPIPGPLTEQMQAIAAEHEVYLVVGLVEQDPANGNLYNSAALIGSQGVVGVYRKIHLSAEDRAWATPGDGGLPVFDIPPGRTGLLIGYDALFPEAARELALQGADIVACPSLLDGPQVRSYGATTVPFPEHVETGPTADHFHLWRERERENHVHVLFANGGAPWMGWSGIFAAVLETEPRVEVVIPGNAEGAVSALVSTSTITREKPMVGMRMPIWYDAMQVPVERAAQVARVRGARREAWLGE